MKVILNGSCGRMGAQVLRLIEEGRCNSELAATVDRTGNAQYPSCEDVDVSGDVIIDFSNHSSTSSLIRYAVKTKTPVVIATTGHLPEEIALIEEAAKEIPVFFSANMSMGIALLSDLARKAALVMGDADIEIVETHHNKKLDAPSGTALLLADSIIKARPELKIKSGRSGFEKREKTDLGIQSLRYGNVVGEHEIIIATETQTIRLKHEAHDRALFAEGALKAAEFLIGKPAGKYDMKDMFI